MLGELWVYVNINTIWKLAFIYHIYSHAKLETNFERKPDAQWGSSCKCYLLAFSRHFFAEWKLWHSIITKLGSRQSSSYLDICRVGEGAARETSVGSLLYYKAL